MLGSSNENIKSEEIKLVIREVVSVYEKAGVTIISPKMITYKISILYNDYDNMRKNAKYVDNPPDIFC